MPRTGEQHFYEKLEAAAARDYGTGIEQWHGPDCNGDYAVLLDTGEPVIVYEDGTTDRVSCTWEDLCASATGDAP